VLLGIGVVVLDVTEVDELVGVNSARPTVVDVAVVDVDDPSGWWVVGLVSGGRVVDVIGTLVVVVDGLVVVVTATVVVVTSATVVVVVAGSSAGTPTTSTLSI
jgi:hypothetical protein